MGGLVLSHLDQPTPPSFTRRPGRFKRKCRLSLGEAGRHPGDIQAIHNLYLGDPAEASGILVVCQVEVGGLSNFQGPGPDIHLKNHGVLAVVSDGEAVPTHTNQCSMTDARLVHLAVPSDIHSLTQCSEVVIELHTLLLIRYDGKLCGTCRVRARLDGIPLVVVIALRVGVDDAGGLGHAAPTNTGLGGMGVVGFGCRVDRMIRLMVLSEPPASH